MPQQTTTDSGVANVSSADLALLTTLDGHIFPEMLADTVAVLGFQHGALVLVTGDAVWFRSRVGFPEAQTPLEGPLWAAAMMAEGAFVVDDLRADPRFAAAPNMVGGIEARFFASCAFRSQDGRPIGLYCLAGPDPAVFGPRRAAVLTALAATVERQLAAIHELDRAAEVQRSLIPATVPQILGYEVAGACVPAKAVGGDFYDWYAIEGGMAFTLVDVMGKGVAPPSSPQRSGRRCAPRNVRATSCEPWNGPPERSKKT